MKNGFQGLRAEWLVGHDPENVCEQYTRNRQIREHGAVLENVPAFAEIVADPCKTDKQVSPID